MNAKEKYDNVINLIEDQILEAESLKPIDIATSITKNIGIALRDLASVFLFFTDNSLISYIRDRQLMAAYRIIIDSKEFIISDAISFTGYSDQPTFTKAFRKLFDMTPKEAWNLKDDSKIKPPLFWDNISTSENKRDKAEEDDMKIVEIFGMKPEKFAALTEALALKTIYGFDQQQCEMAVDLARRYKTPLKEAFSFVDDFYINSLEVLLSMAVLGNEPGDLNIIDKSFVLCSQLGLSIDQTLILINDFRSVGQDVENIKFWILDLYLKYGRDYLGINRYWEIITYIGGNSDQYEPSQADINDLIRVIDTMANPTNDINTPEQAIEFWEEEETEMEKMIAADMSDFRSLQDRIEDEYPSVWEQDEGDPSQYERFDKEYDMDNYGFEMKDEVPDGDWDEIVDEDMLGLW